MASRLPGRVVRSLLATIAALALAGCSPGGPAIAPSGVDELVVPTPTPRPQDFVATIDNPWLAWEPGAVTVLDSVAGEVTQEVSSTTTEMAGLEVTTLTTTAPYVDPVEDLFAQDRAGNVWWLGRQGEWLAGQDGAEAGLWLPAQPRVGDGFRLGLAPGTSEDVARIVLAPPADAGSAYDDANTEDGSAGDEVRLEVRSELEPGRVESRAYVQGTGLIAYGVTGAPGSDVLWTLPES